MSKGPGKAQRRIIEILAAYPKPTVTIHELAAFIYPEAPSISHSQYAVVSRAAGRVAEKMGWKKWRSGGTAGLKRGQLSAMTQDATQAELALLASKMTDEALPDSRYCTWSASSLAYAGPRNRSGYDKASIFRRRC